MSLELTTSPEELRKQFFGLRTRSDVAKMLDVGEDRLIYHLYIVPPHKRYEHFKIPKKSGGTRDIASPATALKILQRKLNQVLQQVYQPKASVHGFIGHRNILSNARPHAKQKFVLNIDLEGFFPSINFGRVRGMFMAAPYERNAEVATILAQICCFDNQLPQGAPTSPIISNMLCAKMDSQLLRLAQKHRCIYTRYADDITFSTHMPQFPQTLAKISERTGQLELGDELAKIVRANGFKVNTSKIRLQTEDQRQGVTGLTVNKFPNVERRYIRQIRAMLHAWEKFGLDAAEKEFIEKYYKKHHNPKRENPLFKQVVKGKIEFLGMVRGKTDDIYITFCSKLRRLAPELMNVTADVPNGTIVKPLVITEGKTDWKHLKAAFARLKDLGLHRNLDIDFQEDEGPKGGDNRLRMCSDYAQTFHGRPIIFIFDRDKPDNVKQANGEKGYKHWGNGVFSFPIPIPDHRRDTPEISIEFYYKDSEIKRKDIEERRLFLGNEFHPHFGNHKTEELHTVLLNKINAMPVIIDEKVFNKDNENMALPKSKFADYVLTQAENFNGFDVSEFGKIFDVIAMIIREYSDRMLAM